VTNRSSLTLVSGAIFAFAGVVSCGHAEENASYGTRVKFRANQKIDFPDFRVEYLGERRKILPVYPRGFLYYDFKIKLRKWFPGLPAQASLIPRTSNSTANLIISSYAGRRSSEN
jgi:hypothetical protein